MNSIIFFRFTLIIIIDVAVFQEFMTLGNSLCRYRYIIMYNINYSNRRVVVYTHLDR